MNRKAQPAQHKPGREERSVTPLYHQVYVVLRQRILDGELQPDRPLPGENQLARDFGVSRVTIRKTLEHLEQDGFIVKHRGIGSYPVPQAAEFRNRYSIGGLMEPGASPDDSAKMTTLSIEMVHPPAHIREKLADTAVNTANSNNLQVLRLIRLRSLHDEPFTLMTAYFSSLHAADIDHASLRKMPPPAALEATGVSIERAEQWISARAADESTAPLLNVPVGTALIFMGTTFLDKRDRPLIALESLYRPDLYEYRSTMRRSRSGKWQPVNS